MSESYDNYLKTEYWQSVAKAVKARAKFKCQVCNSPLDLVAHHRTYENRGKELEHLDDLICLCRRCHEVFHGKISLAIEDPPKQSNKGAAKYIDMKSIEDDMPCGNWPITLNMKLIDICMTARGGYSGETLRALGVGINPKSGWRKRLIGTVISRDSFRLALIGRLAVK